MRYSVHLMAAALLLSAACAPAAPPSDAPPASAADAGSIAAAHRAWEARGPDAYAYQLEISCFCIHRGQYAVEVRDGRITSARDAATGAPAADDRLQWLVTVDGLFQAMGEAARNGTPVRAEYHPELGHPTEVEIGMLANDSGTLYRITGLRAL